MNEVDPAQFAVLIYKVEALTAQLAATNINLDKNVDKMFIQFTAYLESNNQRHDEADDARARDKAELIARVVALETEKRSFSDKLTGGVWTIKAAGILAFFVILYLVKGAWDAIVWIGEKFLGH